MVDQDTIMTLDQFADYMKVSRRCIEENWLYRKDFPSFRVGRVWRIKAEKALAYLENQGSKKK